MKQGEGLRSCCRKRWEDLWPKPGGVLGSSRREEGMGGRPSRFGGRVQLILLSVPLCLSLSDFSGIGAT